METITIYRYEDFSQIDEWDADQLMRALCDIPIEEEVQIPIEEEPNNPPLTQPSPRSTGRTSEIVHQLQADVEKMNYLYMQQTEEICFLKLRIEKLEEKQKKNINNPKKIIHGQSKGIYPKKSTTADLSSSHLHHARQVKPRRS